MRRTLAYAALLSIPPGVAAYSRIDGKTADPVVEATLVGGVILGLATVVVLARETGSADESRRGPIVDDGDENAE